MNTAMLVSARDQKIMIDAYMDGKSLATSARLVGREPHACRNALIRRGITPRSKQQAMRLLATACTERYFSRIDSEEKAYWLGFVTADGNVFGDWKFSVLLSRIDRDHLEHLAVALGCAGAVKDRSYTRDGKTYLTCSLQLRSRAMVSDLARHGLCPRKSLVVCPWQGPARLMPHYWRGVFDGDGCIHRRNNGYWSVSLVGSIGIVTGFADFIARQLGCSKQPKPAGKIFSIHCGGIGLPQTVVSLLYQDASVYLSRKKALADELGAATPKHPFGSRRDFSWITPEYLLSILPPGRGGWARVAERLEVTPANLHQMRKRLGMT